VNLLNRLIAGASRDEAIEEISATSVGSHNRGSVMSSQPVIYQIRLKGHLGPQWAAWFAGLTLTLEENGDTLLTGPVADQAALHGLLRKVRDLGLPLLAVTLIEPDQADASAVGSIP
jgi:hypothetical protein